MSIANLFVPNEYNLYADTITADNFVQNTSGVTSNVVTHLINDGLTPDSARPPINAGPQDYMIRAYDGQNGPTSPQGFLRLAAGGGTLSTDQSGIDIAGSSNVSALDKSVAIYTSGSYMAQFKSDGFRIFNNTAGYTATPIYYFEEYVGDAVITGALSTTITNGLQIQRLNNKVSLFVSSFSGNLTNGTLNIAIPARFVPFISTNTKAGLIAVTNNSVATVGNISIDKDNGAFVTISAAVASGNFSAGPGGIPNDIEFSYYLN